MFVGDEVKKIIKEVQSGVCDEHQVDFGLFQLIHLGCYWPTMEVDAASFTRRF